MNFVPTTTLALQRPTVGEDDYGDETNTWGDPTSVPAAVAERRRTVFDPTSGRTATITYHEALVPSESDVAKGDRAQDETTGEYLHVTHVHRPQNLVFPGGVARLELTDPDGVLD